MCDQARKIVSMLTPGGSNVAKATAIAVGWIRSMQKPVAVTSELIEVHRVTAAECVFIEHNQSGIDERLELLTNTTEIHELARLFSHAERDAGGEDVGGSGGGQFEKTEEVFYLAGANDIARFRWHLLLIRVACIPFPIP